MTADRSTQYLLSWKGRPSGPFSVAAIREQLVAGEISRMHQVQVGGEWIVLDEFLARQENTEEAARRAAVALQEAEQARRDMEEQLAAERLARQALEERPAFEEEVPAPPLSPLSHLLPPDAREPVRPPLRVMLPEPPPLPPLPPLTDPLARRRWIVAAVVVGGLLVLAAVVALAAFLINRAPDPGRALAGPRLEVRLLTEYQKALSAHRQEIFTSVHPTGDATRLTVHDVTINSWKRGQETSRFEDVRQMTLRFTLHWQGPLEENGQTRINLVYDGETRRFTTREIVATNGRTNADAQSALNSLLSTFLKSQ